MTEFVKFVPVVALFAIAVRLTYRIFLVYKSRLALVRDLDLARIQGRQWRDETRALLKGPRRGDRSPVLDVETDRGGAGRRPVDTEGSEPERNRRSAGHQRTNDPRTGTIALREGRPERPCRPLGVLPGGSARTNRVNTTSQALSSITCLAMFLGRKPDTLSRRNNRRRNESHEHRTHADGRPERHVRRLSRIARRSGTPARRTWRARQ